MGITVRTREQRLFAGHWLRIGATVLCLSLAGCVFRSAPPRPVEVTSQVAAAAERVSTQARAVEPEITAELKRIAPKAGGTLIEMEHRLKTEPSIAREIQTMLAATPDVAPADVVVYDALRYRMLVTDKPLGQYLKTMHTTMARLEERDQRVVEVRNYWPPGDSYSAAHVIFVAPTGLRWELQFHTPRSMAAAKRGRRLYERMRLETTPIEERQALFEQLVEIWAAVPIPDGILEPGAIHPLEQIKTRPAPTPTLE
jgi:hypothetical protein